MSFAVLQSADLEIGWQSSTPPCDPMPTAALDLCCWLTEEANSVFCSCSSSTFKLFILRHFFPRTFVKTHNLTFNSNLSNHSPLNSHHQTLSVTEMPLGEFLQFHKY